MKKLVTPLIFLSCIGLAGCGDSVENQVSGQQQTVQATANLEDAQVEIRVGQGSLSGQGDNLQLVVDGVSQLTVTTERGTQVVSADQIDEILAGERVQAVLEVGTDPPTVYSLSLFDAAYDPQSGTLRFSASPFEELPEWYDVDETVLFGNGPLQFTNATLLINAAEEGPVGDDSPPLLGGAPGFQTDTVYFRYEESSGTAKLSPRSVEIKTPLSIAARNTVSGELKFDFPLEFADLSVSPLRNNLGFALTANRANVSPPDAVTVPYSLTISSNTTPGTYGVPAFTVSGPSGFDAISLKVQVVP